MQWGVVVPMFNALCGGQPLSHHRARTAVDRHCFSTADASAVDCVSDVPVSLGAQGSVFVLGR